MVDIEQILFEEFSNQQIKDDANYRKLVDNVLSVEKQIVQLIGDDKMNLIRDFEKVTSDVQEYDERRLIRFILTFIRKIFNK